MYSTRRLFPYQGRDAYETLKSLFALRLQTLKQTAGRIWIRLWGCAAPPIYSHAAAVLARSPPRYGGDLALLCCLGLRKGRARALSFWYQPETRFCAFGGNCFPSFAQNNGGCAFWEIASVVPPALLPMLMPLSLFLSVLFECPPDGCEHHKGEQRERQS